MKVILLQNIKSIGKAGDIKDVSDGYARNFLLPKKLAEIATEAAVKKSTENKMKENQVAQSALEEVKKIAAQLQGKEIIIKAKEKNGKLFGSITAKNIAEELKKENLPISEDLIKLSKPIKEVGEYSVKIELGHKIDAGIKVIIASEK